MPLLRTLFSRLITTLITLIGVAVIVFFVIRVVPGNPIAMMLPPGATDEDINRLTALYGLDKTLPQQFLIWISGVLHGDFGTSITTRQPVLALVLSRLPATLELSVMALIIACLIGGFAALTGTRLRGTRTSFCGPAIATVSSSSEAIRRRVRLGPSRCRSQLMAAFPAGSPRRAPSRSANRRACAAAGRR